MTCVIDHVGIKATVLDLEYVSQDGNEFTLSWAINKFGFGQFYFARREDGGIYCGDEYMKEETVEAVLTKYCNSRSASTWPKLLKDHGGPRQLMAAVTRWEHDGSK